MNKKSDKLLETGTIEYDEARFNLEISQPYISPLSELRANHKYLQHRNRTVQSMMIMH